MVHFYERVNGSFSFREIYDKALLDARNGAVFVEIGSWYGRSTAYMAVEIANSGKQIDFYCVDTWTGSADLPWTAEQLAAKGGSAFPFFRENMKRGNVLNLIKTVHQPPVQAASSFGPDSVDFVMIDGAHNYADVRDDVRAWLPKLKQNGLMAGDDADWPGVLTGVYETIPFSEVNIANCGANWWYRKQRPSRGFWSVVGAPSHSLDHLTYIPYVNRPDLLDLAVASIPDLWASLIVIDQSSEGLNSHDHRWMNSIAGVFRSPFGTMHFAQMMNWAQTEAFERHVDYLVFMHNDAECLGGVASRVLDCARSHRDAGVVFTYYDAFAVFNVAAIRDVGPWDETFWWYFSDNDYYRRMRLRNWQHHNFGGQEFIHQGSQTQRSDPAVGAQVGEKWSWLLDHYRHKWGGSPGQERYSIPYNGKP
jgi:SAM-dependent methyltransferase